MGETQTGGTERDKLTKREWEREGGEGKGRECVYV